MSTVRTDEYTKSIMQSSLLNPLTLGLYKKQKPGRDIQKYHVNFVIHAAIHKYQAVQLGGKVLSNIIVIPAPNGTCNCLSTLGPQMTPN